jgi:hypothetical protein
MTLEQLEKYTEENKLLIKLTIKNNYCNVEIQSSFGGFGKLTINYENRKNTI